MQRNVDAFMKQNKIKREAVKKWLLEEAALRVLSLGRHERLINNWFRAVGGSCGGASARTGVMLGEGPMTRTEFDTAPEPHAASRYPPRARKKEGKEKRKQRWTVVGRVVRRRGGYPE